MSKTKSSSGRPRPVEYRPGNKPAAEAAIHFLPPLRPRRKLLAILGVVLAAWMIVLLVMYFKTVYPARHDDPRKTHEPTILPVN